MGGSIGSQIETRTGDAGFINGAETMPAHGVGVADDQSVPIAGAKGIACSKSAVIFVRGLAVKVRSVYVAGISRQLQILVPDVKPLLVTVNVSVGKCRM